MRLSHVLCAAALAGLAGAANATVLFDSNGFEAPGYALGNLNGQQGFVVDTAGDTRFQVQNAVVAGGSQAVRADSGTNASVNTDWAYPTLNYTPAANEVVVVKADIARTASSTASLNSFGWFLDIYSPSARIARAGLGVTTASQTPPTSIFPVVTSKFSGSTPSSSGTAGSIIYTGATGYANNQFVNVEVDLNFAGQYFDVYINGSSLLAPGTHYPFLAAATALGDADLQVSSTAGTTDVGYFDNYSVTTTLVPEPASLGMLAAVLPLAFRRRKA